MLRSLKPLVYLLTLLLLSTKAVSGNTLAVLPADYRLVGSGQLSWFGLRVYQATLYAKNGRYDPDDGYALHITYGMSISKTTLVSRTLSEIERLFGSQGDSGKTAAILESVFCDVGAGDSILGLHIPGQSATFYCNDELLGEIEDPPLAQAFFAIWLHRNTSEPGLRKDLLGQSS